MEKSFRTLRGFLAGTEREEDTYFAHSATLRIGGEISDMDEKRRKHGQPHTRRDDILLLLAAFSLIGVLLCFKFLKPLNVLVNSRVGMTATLIVVGAGLTYIFNRWGTPHS